MIGSNSSPASPAAGGPAHSSSGRWQTKVSGRGVYHASPPMYSFLCPATRGIRCQSRGLIGTRTKR